VATIDQLNALASAVPEMNKKAKKTAQANQLVQTQAQVGAAQPAPGMSTTRLAQAAAPQVQQAQAQIVATAAQQNQQQLGQVAQMGLAQQAADGQEALAAQQRAVQEQLAAKERAQKLEMSRADLAMRKKVTGAEQAAATRLQGLGIEQDNKLQIATIRQREQLERLGGDVQDRIVNDRLRFERDETGLKFSNERQLADYNILNSQTQDIFDDKMREMAQTRSRKIQLLEAAAKRMEQSVRNAWSSGEQLFDNQSKQRIAQMVIDMKETIRREQAAAANTMARWQAGGAIVGGIIGIVGGPAGIAAGAAVGGAVGSTIGARQANK
jgi:hypothetical protein